MRHGRSGGGEVGGTVGSLMRPNLIVMRAGDTSLHPSWFEAEAGARNWDLHISYFGDRAEPYGTLPEGVTLSFEKGAKGAGLDACFRAHPGLTDGYGTVMVADDDLQLVTGSWSHAFDRFNESGALLGQAALDHRSFFSHDVTLHRKGCLYREVNFVEIMSPIFKGEFLRQFLDMFTISKTTWGLDLIMSAKAQACGGKIVIIDDVQMLHTRQVGAVKGNYGDVACPREDRDQALAKAGVKLFSGRTRCGVRPDGSRVSGWRLSLPPISAYYYQLLKSLLGVKVIQI